MPIQWLWISFIGFPFERERKNIALTLNGHVHSNRQIYRITKNTLIELTTKTHMRVE